MVALDDRRECRSKERGGRGRQGKSEGGEDTRKHRFSKKWREGPSRRRIEERGKRKEEWRVKDERCQSSEGAERSRKKTVEAEEDPA